jgi:hypothetical protein
MDDDYYNTDEIANLSEDELRTLVRSELRAQPAFDADDITVNVRDGHVSVEGRVGTEVELRVVDHVLTDVIGLQDAENLLVVDAMRRAESPEAIDEHLVDEDEHAGILLGDKPGQFDSEAEHLGRDRNRNPRATHDVTQAIEEAEPWIPPEGPTPEGYDSGESARDVDDR